MEARESREAGGLLLVDDDALVLRLTRGEATWTEARAGLDQWWEVVARAVAAAPAEDPSRQRTDRLVLPLDSPRELARGTWSLGLLPAASALGQAAAVGVPEPALARAAGEALALAAVRWCLAAGAEPSRVVAVARGHGCPSELSRRLGRSANRNGAAAGGRLSRCRMG